MGPEIKALAEAVGSETTDLEGMAQALRDAIPVDKANQNAYRVIDYLASETIRRTQQGLGLMIATKDIHLDLDGNRNQDASAWMSSLWGTICNKIWPQIQAAVIRHCEAGGLTHYPTIEKQGTGPVYYVLVPKPIVAVGQREERDVTADRLGQVRYEPDLTLKLSRIGNWVFRGGLAWTRIKRWGFAVSLMLVTLVVLGFSLLVWFVLAYKQTPLSAADVISGLLMALAPWYLMRKLDQATRIFEDRIVLAPIWALAWKEFGATMEMEGERDLDAPRSLKVARYTATCCVCGAMVKLDEGEPDFPRRLVGRCQMSPREHVFSFDRVTRAGEALRAPPL